MRVRSQLPAGQSGSRDQLSGHFWASLCTSLSLCAEPSSGPDCALSSGDNPNGKGLVRRQQAWGEDRIGRPCCEGARSGGR